MASEPKSPVKDEHYDLISVVQASLHYVWQMDEYARDAEKAGDEELATWYRKIRENNKKAGDQGKELLAKRLSKG